MSAGVRFWLALAPLLAFYFIERYYGLTAGVFAAMGFASIELAWHRIASGQWHKMSMFTAGLVLCLGGLSVLGDDERFVLYAPAIGDLIFAAVLAVAEVRGTSLMLYAMKEQSPDLELHPLQVRFLRGLSWRFCANLVLHAAATFWAAGESRETWLLVSGPLQYGMIGVQTVLEILYARYVLGPEIDLAEAIEARIRAAEATRDPVSFDATDDSDAVDHTLKADVGRS